MLRAILLMIVAGLFAACSRDTPASPAPAKTGLPQITPLTVLFLNCEVAGEEIACTAIATTTSANGIAQQDVTATAQWTALPAGFTQLVAPGRFRATRAGEVLINATGEGMRTLLPIRFAVSPGEPPRRLGSLLAMVRDPAGAMLVGATVEVLDGYRAGAKCTTSVGGMCAIESIVTNEAFDLRATKAGYQPSTVKVRPGESGLSSAFATLTLTPQ